MDSYNQGKPHYKYDPGGGAQAYFNAEYFGGGGGSAGGSAGGFTTAGVGGGGYPQDAATGRGFYQGARAGEGINFPPRQVYEAENMNNHYYNATTTTTQQQGYEYPTHPVNGGGNSGRGGWDRTEVATEWHNRGTESTADGSFYFHSDFSPQIFGFPVSSLAYDKGYESLYVASTTQAMSSTRWRSHQASMLVTHTIADNLLYSSVAGHPEASPSTLQAVYECMYGFPKTVPMPPGRQHIPPHAYRPPFGGINAMEAPPPIIGASSTSKQTAGHMGITSIIPLYGHSATVSPAAVRVHANGGLQLHDYDIEGMLCGTVHPHSDHQGATPTHISVGGLPIPSKNKKSCNEIHCLDLWQGLRPVTSQTFKDTHNETKRVAVTTMVTSHERGSVVAGCSDGNIRVLDGSLRELATIKSHLGGVSSMAVSPDGILIATTGYTSRGKGKDTSFLYAFPDPTVLVYDIRYLGRGGMPHPFAGVRSAPHHVTFVPDMEGLPSNRLLVASGQAGGGVQTLVPFEAQNEKSTTFLLPQLEQNEFISALAQSDANLALGTSSGRVLTYRLAGFQPAIQRKPTPAKPGRFSGPASKNAATAAQSTLGRTSAPVRKQPLEMPPFIPPLPAVSLDPSLLLASAEPGIRNGANDKVKSVMSTYVLDADPRLTSIGNSVETAVACFGPLASQPIIASGRRTVAPGLIHEAATADGDFLLTIPTSRLEVDLLENHIGTSKRYRGKNPKEARPNPNKLLHSNKLSSICYEDGLNGKRRLRGQRSGNSSGDLVGEIPKRYRLQLRPAFKASASFDPSEHNNTGLIPGWDYPPTMPNSFAPPVLLLLYFVPEIRSVLLAAQFNEKMFSARGYEKALAPELGFIFHQIESLSRYGLVHPEKPKSDPLRPRIATWVPSNFLTALATMPEAEQLQILDGSPAAVDPPRRPEAFYRFLAYQLDKELSKNSDLKLMDALHGLDFISINQFISGSSPPSHSTTRALTLELSYDTLARETEKRAIRFGELLQQSLCRETRLRAWNHTSKAYETIVQRKITTSLPQILTLSCACAGRKEEDGLWLWRTDDGSEPWLPEMVEIELFKDGNVIVKQKGEATADNGGDSWSQFEGTSSLPPSVSELVSKVSTPQKIRYQLEAVVSFVNDDTSDVGDDETAGHHVIHARVTKEYKKRILKCQQEEAGKLALQDPNASKLMLTAGIKSDTFRKRSENAGKQLASINDDGEHCWVLFNGYVVEKTVHEDARAFHVPFKEPCLVVYRAVDGKKQKGAGEVIEKKLTRGSSRAMGMVSEQVLNARSLSSVPNKFPRNFNSILATERKLVAFDAEFVSVQEEEATLTEAGSKLVLRDTRHAVGRISVIDCDTREILIDDHVLPRERIVDYLTRFSGIVPDDLDPAKTSHHLISTRSAYLKLRYLVEKGCIFVGHGLRQDFATVNLIVPPHQVLDTVEIYHQPGMRYISLRFLTNCVLGRDMQQDIHDSVEDALAAFELYETALRWHKDGTFEKKLQDIYSYGQRMDWKLGIENVVS